MLVNANRPADVPCLSPYLTVEDSELAIAFYQSAFGFRLKEAVRNDAGGIVHVEMLFDEAK